MTDKTITREQFAAAVDMVRHCRADEGALHAAFTAAGIRIIDDAPPEGVVKLAQRICDDTAIESWNGGHLAVAIAVIMHARKAVERNAERYDEDATLLARDILRELGGNDER